MTPGSLPPAFALAAAACRAPGEARDAAVRAAASAIDWPRFRRVLARHRVEGLAWEALRQAGVAPDGAEAAALQQDAAAIAIEGLRMAAEAARLQAVLDGDGIDALVLKGAAVEMLAWGRLGLKRAWDIDLLVMPDDALRARRSLEAAGFALADPAAADDAAFLAWVGLSKEAVLRRDGDGMIVELHWRLADAAGLLPGLNARSPSQVVRVAPALALRTLADEALFAYLCAHGASHAWSRLKWLADLGAFLAQRDEAERARLYRQALALGAGHAPAAAFVLCDHLLALPIPAAIVGEVRGDRKARRLAALALDALIGGEGETEIEVRPLFAERILISHFLLRDGWGFRLAEWRRQWTSLDDHMRLRLPARLSILYAVVRVPNWIGRRLRRRFSRP